MAAGLQAAVKGFMVAIKPKCARLVFAFFHFGALLIKLVKMLRTHFFFPLKHARVYAA